MGRNIGISMAVLLLGIALGAGGWLLGSRPSHAQEPSVAVGAVATDWVTNFEPDPFERGQTRRTTVSVTRVLVLWNDGRTELRQVSR